MLKVDKEAKLSKEFFVNEGNLIGGQEAQAEVSKQTKITASAKVDKGQVVEITDPFKVGPSQDDSIKFAGIANNNAEIGDEVVICTEGFVKLTATGSITAGDTVVSGADGTVKKSAGTGDVVGKAFSTATEGTIVYVKLK